ncbi:ATP-binding cassette domain-containing protein, partial [Escherichia coli]|nr:ATP-binding cassette domain-containing protein [Escherichia coli]
VALLGPSGCGKTTLLKSIAGFLQPESGRILIDGQDVSRLPAHRRPLNTVFQNYALFPHMTVLENVVYGPRRQGASKSDAADRARDA